MGANCLPYAAVGLPPRGISTKVNASGDGFDVYLVASNGRDEYAVDFYGTTIRQEALPVPAMDVPGRMVLLLGVGLGLGLLGAELWRRRAVC